MVEKIVTYDMAHIIARILTHSRAQKWQAPQQSKHHFHIHKKCVTLTLPMVPFQLNVEHSLFKLVVCLRLSVSVCCMLHFAKIVDAFLNSHRKRYFICVVYSLLYVHDTVSSI